MASSYRDPTELHDCVAAGAIASGSGVDQSKHSPVARVPNASSFCEPFAPIRAIGRLKAIVEFRGVNEIGYR